MSSTAEFRAAFVERLKDACDRSEHVPPPNKGRQQFISTSLGVAPEAVSKWFHGVSMPRPVMMVKLAELLGVEQTWLSYGVSPEMDRKERKDHGREINGAVHYVMGLAMLAGINCAVPSEKDTRARYVDFYATIRGSAQMVSVSLGRDVGKGEFEFTVPTEYPELMCIGVLSTGTGRFVLLSFPDYLIDKVKVLKGAGYTLVVEHVEASKYGTGTIMWPVIRSFADLK